MMIRFYNGRVLEGSTITENEVWVDGDHISYVGPAKADAPAFDRQIDLKGDLLMPSFKNAHTHSGMTFLRSLADDLPLQEWLTQQIFPQEAKLNAERLGAFTKVAMLEYLANGITACFDMYYYTDEFTHIAADWGFRVVLCESLSAGDNWERVYTNYEKYNHMSPLISYQLGFHAEYTGSLDMFKFISQAAHDLKAPVWCHNSETASEVQGCVQRYGVTPTELFESCSLYDYGGGGFHCVWMTDDDLDIFARRGLYAVLNPCSNGKLASGVAPLRRMVDKGVKLAIGTDGPASNNALDFFREMYLVNILAKLEEKDAAAGDPALILDAATAGGARAMGLYNCDSIAAGRQADMIVIDLHRPNMQPVNNILKNLIYSGNPSNVRMTMVAGRVLYQDGEFFVGEEPEKIYAEAQRLTRELLEE
ncbi:MAG: amidohydrolase [Oscillospiraceae bacterium]|nr:amidohydrolase [Oscillospiraceae bacterium]